MGNHVSLQNVFAVRHSAASSRGLAVTMGLEKQRAGCCQCSLQRSDAPFTPELSEDMAARRHGGDESEDGEERRDAAGRRSEWLCGLLSPVAAGFAFS
jgi:hypothetical protein